MEVFIGVGLALAIFAMANLVGFDRSRSFYPVVMIVIASYYCLFAVMGGSVASIWLEAGIAAAFTAVAIAGFRISDWLIVAALAAHGVMDLFHHSLVANAGVPFWWPGFCSAVDITAAAYLALSIMARSASNRSASNL